MNPSTRPSLEQASDHSSTTAPAPAAERERGVRRRRFLVAAMTGLIAIGGGFWTWDRLRAQGTSGANPPVIRAVALSDMRLDAVFASGGTAAIQQKLLAASPKETYRVLGWIGRRHVAPLYADLIAALADVNVDVRKFATNALWQIPPAQLKLHLTSLQAAGAAQTDPIVKTEIDDLVAVVVKS